MEEDSSFRLLMLLTAKAVSLLARDSPDLRVSPTSSMDGKSSMVQTARSKVRRGDVKPSSLATLSLDTHRLLLILWSEDEDGEASGEMITSR